MSKRITLDDILKANPHIPEEKLEAYRSALRALRSRGLSGHRYGLVPPFAGRRVSVQSDADQDPRTVELRVMND